MMAQEKDSNGTAAYLPTDAYKPIILSTVESYHRTTTSPWPTSFAGLIQQFSNRPPYSPKKGGRGFLIGNCEGSRANANMRTAKVAVLDADASLLPDGTIESGAPDPFLVHKELVGLNISHLLYTTFSHGTGKGNRYRVIFPFESNNQYELLGALSFVVEALQNAGLQIALTRESAVWSQPWQLPQVSGDQAPYHCYFHVGFALNPFVFAQRYGLIDENGQPKITTLPKPTASVEEDDETFVSLEQEKPSTVIKLFNQNFSALELLRGAGYTFHGQQVIVDERREPSVVYRFKRPGSDSSPGVVAFADPFNSLEDGEPNYCIYSHHGDEDPLANGHANDAFEVYRLLFKRTKHEAAIEGTRMLEKRLADHFNVHSATVTDGGAFKVFNRCTKDGRVYYTTSDWSSFKMSKINQPSVPTIEFNKELNQPTIVFKKQHDWWLSTPKRIQYRDARFKPWPLLSEESQTIYEEKDPYFNQFPGWGLDPYPGEWPLLAEHLKFGICGGIDQEYQYLLDWFAHLFQYPQDKPGVAIVLKGGKGNGKSLPFQLIGEAIGRNALILANNKQLTGQFSGHLETCLLAVVEESYYAGSHQQEGVLKTLITDSQTTFEAKGKQAQGGKSFTRVVLITNEDWAAPATGDERRYFVPSVCTYTYDKDIRNGQKGYFFPQLINEMNNGGIQAFAHSMATRDMAGRTLVNVPETAGLAEQRAYSLSQLESWVFRALRHGRIDVGERTYAWTSPGLVVPECDIYESAAQSASSFDRGRNFTFKVNQALIKSLKGEVSFSDGKVYFDNIDRCRKTFIASTRLDKNVFDGGATGIQVYNTGNVTQFSGVSR